jgi:hypothetical protein
LKVFSFIRCKLAPFGRCSSITHCRARAAPLLLLLLMPLLLLPLLLMLLMPLH